MKTSTFRRFWPLIALLLCASALVVHALPIQPPAPSAAPGETASAATDSESAAHETAQRDWDDGGNSNAHRRHRHHTRGGDGSDLVGIGRDSNLGPAEHADSVVSIFGSSTSDGTAGEVVSVLGNTRVTGEVSDGAVAVLGNTTIDGKVGGDAVAVLGNVELGPHAEIGGDVVAVGGEVLRDPAAIVHGHVQGVFTGNLGNLTGLRIWVQHCLLFGRPLAWVAGLGWAWSIALTCLALYVLLALLFRSGLTQCVRTFETHTGHSVLAALITMLLTPVLVVLLCITVIGIAAVPFIVIGVFCAGLFGKAVILAWIGRRMVREPAAGGTLAHPAFAVLIGGLLVLVLYTIPVLGIVVYKLLGILGMGAVVYTLILAARGWQAAKHEGGMASAAADAIPGPIPTATPDAIPGATSGLAPGAAPAAAHTPTAVTAALPRAGFWVRMAALLLDGLLIGFVTHVLLHANDLHLIALAVYGAVMWKLKGSTVGGLVFDLQVVRLDGRAMDWETAIVRALGCFLSLAAAGLGFFWIAFDDGKQAWHDKIAGTVVVRVAKAAPLV